MKENIYKGIFAAAATAAAAYFRELIFPIGVLGLAMVVDYFSGVTVAWITGKLSSRVGIIGVLKKVGYLLTVGVAVVVDFIVQTAAVKVGGDLSGFYMFGLIVTIWLILNECISILENLSKIGVPLPVFLKKIVEKLKATTEAKGEEALK